MKQPVLYRFCRKAFVIIASALCFLMIFYNSIAITHVSYSGREKVTIEYGIYHTLFIGVITAGVIYLSLRMKKYIEKINEKHLFVFLSLCYLVCAFYLILNLSPKLRADAFWTYNSALSVLENDFSSFGTEGYIHRFPHQTGLMLYDQMLMLFSPNPQLNFFVNFLFVIGINFLSYKIADTVFSDRHTNVITIILSFAFLPQLFFIMFAYGLIPGFFFTEAAFYLTLRYVKENRIKYVVSAASSMGAAVLLKQNFLIAAIALSIYLLLEIFRTKNIKHMALILLLCISVILPGRAVTAVYEKISGTELNQPTPSVLWVAMGTDIDNFVCGPGWFNGYNFTVYQENGYDTELSKEAGNKKIKENLEKIKSNPVAAIGFFNVKAISQWTDPFYQSVWTGPLEDCGQSAYTKLLSSLYGGETAELLTGTFLKAVSMIIWFFAAKFIVSSDKKKYSGYEIMYIFCLGGFLFHIIWEGKSQYIYPYVYCLIPFAAFALRHFCTRKSIKISQRKKRKERADEQTV